MIKIEDTLGMLISCKSYSGQEEEIQGKIHKLLNDAGFDPSYVGGNLVLKVKGKDSSSAFMFNGHVDTVSEGDPDLWTYGAFNPEIREGKMYGLGASDEKAGVASMIHFAFLYSKKVPPCDLWFMFVVKEEVDGSGSLEVMDWFADNHLDSYKKVSGVLVEPTGLSEVEIGHKGNVFLKVTAKGKGGHGSSPLHPSDNSVLIMADALLKLHTLGQAWKGEYKHPILGFPTVGVGTSIQAGSLDVPNKFSDICTSTVDVRTVPSMHDNVVDLIKKHLGGSPVSVEPLYDPAPYGLTEESDSVVLAIKEVVSGVKVSSSKGSTDQFAYTKHGIPAVIFGPGEKGPIHAPDEYVYLDKVEKSIGIYKKIVECWFGMA